MEYEKLDAIYYINLAKRKDRKKEIIKVLKDLDIPEEKVIRMEARDMTAAAHRSHRGAGCSSSHLACWVDAINKGFAYILVLEDDFEPIVTKEFFKSTITTLFAEYEDFFVCNLAYNESGDNPILQSGFKKCNSVQTASAYIAYTPFLRSMIPTIQLSIKNLMIGSSYDINAIDQAWKLHQVMTPTWYLSPRLGKQRASFSDLENFEADYGV